MLVPGLAGASCSSIRTASVITMEGLVGTLAPRRLLGRPEVLHGRGRRLRRASTAEAEAQQRQISPREDRLLRVLPPLNRSLHSSCGSGGPCSMITVRSEKPISTPGLRCSTLLVLYAVRLFPEGHWLEATVGHGLTSRPEPRRNSTTRGWCRLYTVPALYCFGMKRKSSNALRWENAAFGKKGVHSN